MSVLKNVVESMRDKERKAIMEEDQRMAKIIFDQTKKAKTKDDEKLSENEEIKSNMMYVIEKKFMELEQAIKEAIAELENIEEMSPTFGQVIISTYNKLCLYLNKIAKYNTMSHSNKLKIDQRFEQTSSILSDLIFSAGQNNFNVDDLQQMHDYISAKNYKPVGIYDASNYVLNQQLRKDEAEEDLENLLRRLKDRVNDMGKRNMAENRQRKSRGEKTKEDPVLENLRIQRDALQGYQRTLKSMNFNLKSNVPKIEKLQKLVKESAKKIPKGLLYTPHNSDSEDTDDQVSRIDKLPPDSQQELIDKLIQKGQYALPSDDEQPIDSDDDATDHEIFHGDFEEHKIFGNKAMQDSLDKSVGSFNEPGYINFVRNMPKDLRHLRFVNSNQNSEEEEEEEQAAIKRPVKGTEEAKQRMALVRDGKKKKQTITVHSPYSLRSRNKQPSREPIEEKYGSGKKKVVKKKV